MGWRKLPSHELQEVTISWVAQGVTISWVAQEVTISWVAGSYHLIHETN